MVVMTHPETGGVARTTEDAFKLVWEPRGWQLADPVAAAVGDVLGHDVTDVDGLSKEQLLEVAATLGVEGSASSTKKDRPFDIFNDVQDHVLAVAALGHTLVSSIRRRRRDLATLKTLGFTRGQVSATVAWQATTFAPAPFAHQHDLPDEAFRATLLSACNGQLPIQASPLQRQPASTSLTPCSSVGC